MEEAARMAAYDHEEHTAYAPTEDFHKVQLDQFITKTKEEAIAKLPVKKEKSKAARISEIEANRAKEKEPVRERNTALTLKQRGITINEKAEEHNI